MNDYLLLASILNMVIALLHLLCIPMGETMFRFLGAGEEMARMAASGDWRPRIVVIVIASVFLVFAIYALSGAGWVKPLPHLKLVLIGITTIFLARALLFPLLKPLFPSNSKMFWWITSMICLVIGCIHLMGIMRLGS